jgi:hypothetical protein
LDTAHLEPHILSEINSLSHSQLANILYSCNLQNKNGTRNAENSTLESLILYKLSSSLTKLSLQNFNILLYLKKEYVDRGQTDLGLQLSTLIDNSIPEIFKLLAQNQLPTETSQNSDRENKKIAQILHPVLQYLYSTDNVPLSYVELLSLHFSKHHELLNDDLFMDIYTQLGDMGLES